MMTLEELTALLHEKHHSLVVQSRDGVVRTFDGRGVADLYRLWHEEPHILQGADVADKVVGKGATALMIAGGVRQVHTEVVSEAALELFQASPVQVKYEEKVPHIINRAGTGRCPLETLCAPCVTVDECLPVIEGFVKPPQAPPKEGMLSGER